MEEAGFSMLKDKIKDVLDTLTEREREVLEQRFGLKDGYSRTLEEVRPPVPGHPRAHPPDRGQGAPENAPPDPYQEAGRLHRAAGGLRQ